MMPRILSMPLTPGKAELTATSLTTSVIRCLRSRSLSMQPGAAPSLPFTMVASPTPVVAIPILMLSAGIAAMLVPQPIRWRRRFRTTGAFMTCLVTSGNGVKIGMEPILPVQYQTLPGRVLARTACFVAAAGTNLLGTRARRSGAGTRRISPAATWGSDLSCHQVSEPGKQ